MMQEENKRELEQQTQEELVAVGEDGAVQPEDEYLPVGESGPAEPTGSTAAEAPQDTQEKKPLNSGRRDILHLLCGGYLLYLAYKLGTSFIADFPQNGWTSNLVVCIVGAVVFTVVGVILLVGCVKRFLQRMKDTEEH